MTAVTLWWNRKQLGAAFQIGGAAVSPNRLIASRIRIFLQAPLPTVKANMNAAAAMIMPLVMMEAP